MAGYNLYPTTSASRVLLDSGSLSRSRLLLQYRMAKTKEQEDAAFTALESQKDSEAKLILEERRLYASKLSWEIDLNPFSYVSH